MNCENCNKEHDGEYGSGRFCSSKCARGFSTKSKRKEINEKVSNKLKGKYFGPLVKKIKIEKKCLACGKTIEYTITEGSKYNKRVCNIQCFGLLSKGMKTKRGGLREGGGYSKVYEYKSKNGDVYKLNKDEIEVAKVLDILNIKWVRNKKGFEYTDLKNKKRKYYPDFYIEDYDFYIEYKGYVTEEMTHKMKNSLHNNKFKLLIIYSNDKRYRDLGLNLSEIIENPDLIIKNITNIKN